MSANEAKNDTLLLNKFKKSIGDFNNNPLMNDYYNNFLNIAKGDLLTDDISEAVLKTEIGESAVVLYAELLMNKADIATNSTLTLLRNKLSLMTKGDRVDV